MSQKSASAVDGHVGVRVRQRRTQIGMSQEKLGEALGITFQQVQKYEKGTNRIGASRLHHIGAVLGVEVEYFFQGLPPSGPERGNRVQVADFLALPESDRLMRGFVQLSEDGRCKIADLVDMIVAPASLQRSA